MPANAGKLPELLMKPSRACRRSNERHSANDTPAGGNAQAVGDAAYELDAFKPNLTRAEADIRIAALKAKLKLLDGPPHTL